MFSLDIALTTPFNLGVEGFSICVLLIVYHGGRRAFADTLDARLLSCTELFVMLTLLFDIFTWLLNGRPGRLMRALGYFSNCGYFIMQIVVTYMWLQYSSYRIYGRRMTRRIALWAVDVPLAAMVLCVLTSPLTGLCFYLDGSNNYFRGILSTPMSVVTLVYVISASVLALRRRKFESLADRRGELMSISFFPVIPFIGGATQTLFYGLSILWPCVTAAILIIYVQKGNQAISQDFLTGMNNRGTLDRFLQSLADSGTERALTILMADINNFKEINDRFGHDAGDRALVRAADIFRSAFSDTPAFLSRYGGDEFVVVLPERAMSGGDAAARIEKGFEKADGQDIGFALSVSIGAASTAGRSGITPADLLREADIDMYDAKSAFHGAVSAKREA